MKRDDERHEHERLERQLEALDQDIQRARQELERATTAHFEGFFGGPPLPKHQTDSMSGERVPLRDGSTVVIRPCEPADASLVKEGFEELSAVERYRRFLFNRPRISDAEARELTTVDPDHEALGAIDPETGVGVGLARYVRDDEEPTSAVAAVIVVDKWQGRGVATRLLQRLAERALAAGIERFDAHMIVGDTSSQRMFESVGSVETTRRANGTVDVTVRLAD
jgi:GNAT superfamily N-acetyltransferase